MPHGDLHGDSKPLVTPDSEEQEEKPKSKPKSKATNGKKANGAAGKAKKVSTVLCPSNSISDPAFELLGQTVKAEDVADDGDDRMQDIEEEVVKPPSSKQRKVCCRLAASMVWSGRRVSRTETISLGPLLFRRLCRKAPPRRRSRLVRCNRIFVGFDDDVDLSRFRMSKGRVGLGW
jgi:hypothetical protein